MADSRDIVVSVNVIRDPRGAVIQTQLIKNEPPYVKAGIVTTIVGKDGSLIYTGSGVPSNELGVFTDLYIDNVAPNNFYQKDANDVWILKGNLQGGKGDDGREVLIQNNGTYIQWQYDGDETWTNIVDVATLKGDTGSNIELQKGITHIQWRVVGDTDWIDLIAIADLKGADGRGIVSFDLINTVGKTKTYRLLYTDSTYVDINIIDGNDGNDGATPYIGLNGNWWINGVDKNVKAEGVDGRGIVSIIKTSTVGLVDTYTITYSDATTSTFDVTNGTNGEMNVIEEVQVNSVPLEITDKSVNVIVPTQPSDIGAEPANSNIQSHISNTNIHIDSSSELGEAINESTHSLLLWNGLKALKVTFARLKTWIGSYFFAIGGNTFGAKKLIGSTDNQDFGIITNNSERVTVLKDGNVGIRTINPLTSLHVVKANDRNTAYYDVLTLEGKSTNGKESMYGPRLLFSQNDPANGRYIVSGAIVSTANMNYNGTIFFGNLEFQTKSSSSVINESPTTKMVISPMGNVGIDTTAPKSKLQVNGGIQCGDDTAAASADKVGTIRQRDVDNKTKLEFVRNNNGTYEWEQINDKLSLDQSTPQTLTDSPIINTLTSGQMCYADSNKKILGSSHIKFNTTKNRLEIGNYVETYTETIPVTISGSIMITGSYKNTAGHYLSQKGELYVGGSDFKLQQYNGSAIITRLIIVNTNGYVCVGGTDPKSKMDVRGGVRVGDDTAVASADKVGTIRQRDVDNKTKLEFVRNNNGTYEWEQINDKLSLDQSAPQTINGNVNINGSVNPVTTDVNQSTTPSVNASQTAAILQDGSSFTGTDYVMPTNNVAVKIVASAAHTMGDFTIRVKSSATLTSTTATLTGYLYSDNAGSPGTLLATGNAIRHASITTSYQELSLGTQYNMVLGTTYWLVVRWNTAPTGGNIILDSNVSSNLGATSANATTWTLTNVQLRYRLRGRTYYGINAFSTNNIGVYGNSTNSFGVYGVSTNSFGVRGTSTNNVGVYGTSTNSIGVYGTSTNNTGVYGNSTNNTGIYGDSTNSSGVYGESTNSSGVRGASTNNYAGYFTRNTQTPTSSVSVLYAYQQHASNTNSVFDIRQNGTGEIIRGFSNTTQTFSVTAAGLGIFAKGVQIGDNTDAASSANKGILRYRENAGGSFFEICMKQTNGSYAWQSIVFNQ